MTSAPKAAAERLRVYQLAAKWAADVERVLTELPVRASLADQLFRAADSVVLNIAEGAAHFTPGQKVRHYQIARGSASEAKAALGRIAAAHEHRASTASAAPATWSASFSPP